MKLGCARCLLEAMKLEAQARGEGATITWTVGGKDDGSPFYWENLREWSVPPAVTVIGGEALCTKHVTEHVTKVAQFARPRTERL